MSGILLAKRHGGAKTGIVLPNIGDSWLGGFYAGIIDTTKSNIIAADYFQTGARFAVILSDVTLDVASRLYKTSNTAAPAEASTLWNGLGATAAMNSATYAAAFYCAGLMKPSGDAASTWYLPAMDELELVWRNLKPVANNNGTNSYTGDFPPYSHATGDNPSSDPVGAAYTTTVPAQTAVTAFKTGGSQAMANSFYWSATEFDATYAWGQYFGTTSTGVQFRLGKSAGYRVRPVRRLALS